MQNNDKRALKSGVWYTFSNFLTKGLVFLTTPIFTRIMSVSAFGKYSAFTTWQSILLLILPLGLANTIARAKLDYEDRLPGYMSSIAIAGTISTGIAYIIVIAFSDFFTAFFNLDMKYIHIMFLYLLFQPAMSIFQGKNHIEFKYKLATVISIASSILSTALAIVLAWLVEDQMLGRIIGYDGTLMIFCIVIYLCILLKGREFRGSYIRYAMRLALPLLPHSVSMYILGSSDKLVIQSLCGDEAVAFYNIGYTCALVISMLSNSVNEAMSPWLFRTMHAKEYAKIKKVNQIYVGLFVFMTIGLLLLAPEIMLIIGGQKYIQAQAVLMPIMAGCCCQFIYTLYVNVENYLKKPGMISVCTVIAATTNVVLNFIFVARYGYEAAAYTTMVCYFMLLILHYSIVRKYGYDHVYNNKLNLLCAVGVCLFGLLIKLIFKTVFRWLLLLVYVVAALAILMKYRKIILEKLKSFF